MEVMRTLVTRILWLAVAGALLYGGFVAYERWWDGDLSLMKERVFSFVNEGAEVSKERAVEAGGEVLEDVKEEATEQVKGAISLVIGRAIESIGETITNYGESVTGRPAEAPAPSGLGYTNPPPPVALTAEVGVSLSFAVNEGGEYVAVWGDGSTDEGTKDATTTTFLRHAWDTPGDYVVTIATKTSSETHTETFPIRIYVR